RAGARAAAALRAEGAGPRRLVGAGARAGLGAHAAGAARAVLAVAAGQARVADPAARSRQAHARAHALTEAILRRRHHLPELPAVLILRDHLGHADAAGRIVGIRDAEGRHLPGAVGAGRGAAHRAEAAPVRVRVAEAAREVAVAVRVALGAHPLGDVDARAVGEPLRIALQVHRRRRDRADARVDLEHVGRLHAHAAVRDEPAAQIAAVRGAEVVDRPV